MSARMALLSRLRLAIGENTVQGWPSLSGRVGSESFSLGEVFLHHGAVPVCILSAHSSGEQKKNLRSHFRDGTQMPEISDGGLGILKEFFRLCAVWILLEEKLCEAGRSVILM
jgi:hypothetical protein